MPTPGYKWTPQKDEQLMVLAKRHTHGRVVWWTDVEEDKEFISPAPSRTAMQFRYYLLRDKRTRAQPPRPLVPKPPVAWKPAELFVSNGHMSTTTVRHCPQCGYDLGRLLEAMRALQQIEDAHNG